MCKYELLTSRLSKVIVCQTDIHTDRTELIYHATTQMVHKQTDVKAGLFGNDWIVKMSFLNDVMIKAWFPASRNIVNARNLRKQHMLRET